MTSRLQVLIVGAGPIGLTLACRLKRLGLAVRVIEKRSGPLGAFESHRSPVPHLRGVGTPCDFGALYQLRSDFLCLIRPDGHVGLVQAPFDETHLIDYLACISAPSEVRRCFV